MSQVASSYTIPPTALGQLRQHLAAADMTGFWNSIRPYEAGAAFPYSGYVVAVLAEYLQEQNIELPVDPTPEVALLVEHFSPLVCTIGANAAGIAGELADL